MSQKKNLLKNLGCRGQGLTEYAIVLSLVAVAAIATTAFFGGAIKARISALTASIAGSSKENIDAENKKAQMAAEHAAIAAKKVDGMSINSAGSGADDGAEVIDEVQF